LRRRIAGRCDTTEPVELAHHPSETWNSARPRDTDCVMPGQPNSRCSRGELHGEVTRRHEFSRGTMRALERTTPRRHERVFGCDADHAFAFR
jgi:hypothetical protein